MTTVLNLTARTPRTGDTTDRAVLPTDMYRMRIMEAKLEDDNFAKPDKDGQLPQKVVLTFEIATLTEEQQEAADEAGEAWDSVRIWHRFNPYYGDVKAGGPSKFKAFIDNLVKWGLLSIPNPELFEVESLAGIELKCSVEHYLKTMGDNAGKPGNKITAFAAAKKAKNTPKPIEADEDLPF